MQRNLFKLRLTNLHQVNLDQGIIWVAKWEFKIKNFKKWLKVNNLCIFKRSEVAGQFDQKENSSNTGHKHTKW